jgi:hypothetical protein
MSGHFPPNEPYDRGMLDGGDGHQANWECCGNHAGKPALYLHGGPGSHFPLAVRNVSSRPALALADVRRARKLSRDKLLSVPVQRQGRK